MAASMKNAICIAGLPGSGKTHLARSFVKKYGCLISDDEGILSEYDESRHWVISDSYLCLVNARDDLFKKLYGFDVTWVFFENDPALCAKSVLTRGDEHGMLKYINWLSPAYKIPNYGRIIPVYRKKSSEKACKKSMNE